MLNLPPPHLSVPVQRTPPPLVDAVRVETVLTVQLTPAVPSDECRLAGAGVVALHPQVQLRQCGDVDPRGRGRDEDVVGADHERHLQSEGRIQLLVGLGMAGVGQAWPGYSLAW